MVAADSCCDKYLGLVTYSFVSIAKFFICSLSQLLVIQHHKYFYLQEILEPINAKFSIYRENSVVGSR
jgi:hypothetical protein